MSADKYFPDTLTVQEVMRLWPATIPVFVRFRMGCIGCAVSPFHTISEACLATQVDETAFRAALIVAGQTVPST